MNFNETYKKTNASGNLYNYDQNFQCNTSNLFRFTNYFGFSKRKRYGPYRMDIVGFCLITLKTV